MDLKEKIVVITGGSEGFGRALAKSFLAEGSRVIISSHEKETLEKTVEELHCDFFLSDVTSQEETRNLAEFVLKKYKSIDIWINNAGIQIAPSTVENVDIKKLQALFEVNFFGYFYGCQVALSHMKKRGEGAIININSTAGLEGKPELSAYVASKFAIRGLTETIRKETAGSEIKIFGVFPGGMKTDIYKEKVPANIDEYMDTESVAEKVIANLKSKTPELDLVIKRHG